MEKKVKSGNTIKDDIQNLIIQKPNTKMFGLISFRLGIYNLAYNKKENKFRWWLKNKLGEAPVIYNEQVSSKSAENIRLYMFNEGFLNTKVNFKAIYESKKVKVNYSILPGGQFYTGKIALPKDSNTLVKHILEIQEETFIEEGEAFSINLLNDERTRITTHLRNVGYFEFRKDYIVFKLD